MSAETVVPEDPPVGDETGSSRSALKPTKGRMMVGQATDRPWMITVFLAVVFLLGWHLATLRGAFDGTGLTEEQLQMMEFNGDVVRSTDGTYLWNPDKEKVKGIPGPLAVMEKAREELRDAFVIKGTNDHGIGYLVFYTVSRFGAGFLAASAVAVVLGVFLGLNKVLFKAVNPFINAVRTATVARIVRYGIDSFRSCTS